MKKTGRILSLQLNFRQGLWSWEEMWKKSGLAYIEKEAISDVDKSSSSFDSFHDSSNGSFFFLFFNGIKTEREKKIARKNGV